MPPLPLAACPVPAARCLLSAAFCVLHVAAVVHYVSIVTIATVTTITTTHCGIEGFIEGRTTETRSGFLRSVWYRLVTNNR